MTGLTISGIYQIRNTSNDSKYIGSAVDIKKRWILHKCQLRKNKHHNPHLQNAWNKYGEDSFEFVILQDVAILDDLIKVEQWYIDKEKPVYNICKVAGSPLGRIPSTESREKMSVSRKGIKYSDETKLRMSISSKGAVFSDEHRAKLSKSAHDRVQVGRIKKGAKLASENINQIREMITSGIKLRDIADKFCVSRSTINSIKLGKAWIGVS